MIAGTINQQLEAVIPLTVLSAAGQLLELDVIIDTGFDGYLTLPQAMVDRLQLPWRRRERVALADGSESIFDIYEAQIFWGGRLRRITVDCADTNPLVGMALLRGSRLTMEVIDAGEVRIETLLP